MSRKTGAKGFDKHSPQTWRERALENFRKVGFVYVGHDIERDLREYVEQLADECDRASNRFSKLKRASEVLRRVARLKSLAGIFPEELGQRRRKTGRPFWIAVDCLLHGSASYSRIARAWKVDSSTLRKYVNTYSESVRLAYGDERNWSLEQCAALRDRVELARAGRPFWIVVDCLLHGSASYRRIARAWKVDSSTLRKYVNTYSESVRRAYGDERNWSLEQRAALRDRVELARERI